MHSVSACIDGLTFSSPCPNIKLVVVLVGFTDPSKRVVVHSALSSQYPHVKLVVAFSSFYPLHQSFKVS